MRSDSAAATRKRAARSIVGPVFVLSVVLFGARPLALGCEDRFFDSNGVAIRYCLSGQGEPIIAIHGSNGSWSGRLADALAPLSAAHLLIGFDIRGHGKSGKPHDPGSYGPELGEDVIRLMDHLHLERAHLVGYSMGGFLALKLATIYPERVRSLAMVAQGLVSPDEFDDMADAAEAATGGATNDPIAIAAMIKSYPVLAVSDRAVRSLRLPVLEIIGERDTRVSRAMRLRALVPGTRLVVLPGRDHGSVLADPRLVPEISAFVDGKRSG